MTNFPSSFYLHDFSMGSMSLSDGGAVVTALAIAVIFRQCSKFTFACIAGLFLESFLGPKLPRVENHVPLRLLFLHVNNCGNTLSLHKHEHRSISELCIPCLHRLFYFCSIFFDYSSSRARSLHLSFADHAECTDFIVLSP